jgi:hypothetical protein
MISKALGRDMLARPDRVVGFLNAATSSLQTDFKSFAAIARLAVSARSIGADNIKFVTTPWVFDDTRVSGGVAWTPAVRRLWRVVIDDKPLSPEFVDQSISAGESPTGAVVPSPSGTPSGSAPPATASPSGGGTGTGTGSGGLTREERAKAGLCS